MSRLGKLHRSGSFSAHQSLNTIRHLAKRRVPGQLVIQLTDHCNGSCPQCGMRKSNPFLRSKLDLKTARRILRSAAQRGVVAVSFTGGEPLLHLEDLTELICYAGEMGIPYIRTGTNGFHFSGHKRPGFKRRIDRLARTLAATPLRNFWISLDSVEPDVHDRMRGFGDMMAGIRKALPIFHQAGIFPSANLGLNRNIGGYTTNHLHPGQFQSGAAYAQAFFEAFKSSLDCFYQRVLELGFTIVNTCYPMSVPPIADNSDLNAVYAATSIDRVVQFTAIEKQMLFKALMGAIPKFCSRIRIFTPLCALYSLIRQHAGRPFDSYPCRGGRDFFFVDAAGGNTYPCGYRGRENLGKFWNLPKKMLDNAECRQCDWECFRDPSELLGPMLEEVWHPFHTLSAFPHRWNYFRHWLRDLGYYQACGFFNGRRPPAYGKMAFFSGRQSNILRPTHTGSPFTISCDKMMGSNPT